MKKDLPTWFILSAINEAKELLKSKKRKVVFGGKRLFTQPCIHHLQGWRLEEVKREWREKRKGKKSKYKVYLQGKWIVFKNNII